MFRFCICRICRIRLPPPTETGANPPYRLIPRRQSCPSALDVLDLPDLLDLSYPIPLPCAQVDPQKAELPLGYGSRLTPFEKVRGMIGWWFSAHR